MSDKTKGLYNKYFVERTDGADAWGKKHDGCRLFVLDLTHDKHAVPAILAYVASCRAEFPALAADLDKLIKPNAALERSAVADTLGGLVGSSVGGDK